jgi:hypothetical protein
MEEGRGREIVFFGQDFPITSGNAIMQFEK